MIYVLTAHHLSADWIDIQLRYLRLHMSEPYMTVASLQGVEQFADRFDLVVGSRGGHAGKLNLMAAVACAQAEPDDILLFLDGDAFPIADPCPTIEAALSEHALVAINRAEVFGDPQPHPAFCAVRVATWTQIRGDWSTGHIWTNSVGDAITDVGANLLWALERDGLTWEKLHRSNTIDVHPLWFAVYGKLIYHHGAAFRGSAPISRLDVIPVRLPGAPGKALRRVERARLKRRRRRELAALSAEVRSEMGDPRFWQRFVSG